MIYRYAISEELPFSFLPYRLIYLYLFFTRSRAKLFLLLKSNVRLTHRRFSLAFAVKVKDVVASHSTNFVAYRRERSVSEPAIIARNEKGIVTGIRVTGEL